MLEFKKLELTDKERLEPYLAHDGSIMADRTFAALYIWRDYYDLQICFKDDFVYFLSKKHEGDRSYYMPLDMGGGDIEKAFCEIERDSRDKGLPYRVYLVTEEIKERLESECPGKYTFLDDRNNYDYIYKASDLMELKGKKFHSKRNHINRFTSVYAGRWSYENVDPKKHITPIYDYTIKWGEAKRGDGYQDDYKHELEAISCALRNYEALGMRGGVLYVDGQVAAYTLAAMTHNKVIDVMFEKADSDIDGAYTMINNQFAINNFSDIELVNREEDMGIQGLRTAKLSYNPVSLTKKYIAMPAKEII